MMDIYFTVSEVSKLIGKSRQTICMWIKDGKLEADRAGNSYLIKKNVLQEFLKFKK